MNFNDFIQKYSSKVYNLAFRLTNNVQDAEDLSQEAFIKLYQNLDKYQPTGSFEGWLYRVINNLYIDGLRKQKKVAIESWEQVVVNSYNSNTQKTLADLRYEPQRIVEKEEKEKIIQQQLNSLPYDFKLVLILCDVEGYAYEEISNILKCPVGTVKSRINRGRKILREKLLQSGIT